MSHMNRPSKKNALLQLKEKLLEELKCCDKQIEEAKQKQTNNNLKYDDSSDSDTELSLRIDKSKSLPSLIRKKSALQTRCNATAELTGLEVLESTVNILTENPDLNGERPVTEEGVWREVIAECKVDLIPFTISFYVHQPNRTFGQPSYRCLRVVASKQANERELNNSVLSKITTPGDAFEVLKSYASAHRSRRSTLARLAELYGDDLFMAPLSEGGYQLQCANVLELCWTLESKTSTVAYFRHRMKLSLEYMDESSLKIISEANKEMSNPSVHTDERTSLLSKIISTCLKAGGETSGAEVPRVQKRPIEPMDVPAKKKKEVMGPPKTLPKKNKIKGKENNLSNGDINKTKSSIEKESNEKQVKAIQAKTDLNSNNGLNEKNKKDKVKDPKVSKDNKIKNQTKDTSNETKKTNDSNKQNNIKSAPKPDLIDNSKKKAQKTVKMNAGKDFEKDKEDTERLKNKTIQEGKKADNAIKENVASKIREAKNSQEANKQIISNEKTFPQSKRINLKPNMKRDPINKNSTPGNTAKDAIKPINKRFGNINKGNILQKTKIPMKMKEKMNNLRISPRTNVKNVTSTSASSAQRVIGDKISNIARFVKKSSGKNF